MSDADKDKPDDGETPDGAVASADLSSLDDDVVEATLVSPDKEAGEADTAAAGGGDDILPGGDETQPAASDADSIAGGGGEDSLAGAGADFSLAGDAAEAGVEAHATPAPQQSGGSRVGAWIVALVIVFLAGVAVWPVFGSAIQSMLPESWRSAAPVDEATQARVASLEDELASLKSRPEAPDSSAAVSALQQTVSAQAAAIATLQEELAAARAATPPAPDTSALERRLDELGARVEALAAVPTPSGDGADSDAVAALRSQLANVAQQLAGLGGSQEALATLAATNAKLQETVHTLEDRLATLETRAGDVAGQRRSEATVLALSQLAADLRAGGGYADSLQAAQALAGDDGELAAVLEPLKAGAATGAADLHQLRRRFDAVAAEIVRAGIADAGGDWMDRTANRLAALVSIRRVGEVAGDSVEAIVARAETRLGYGDLAAAVELLETLEGPPAEAAAGWLAAARERLAANAAADELQRRVATLVGAD